MVYKHAHLNTLLLLRSKFMLSVVKMLLKGEVGGHALNSHGNYIVDHGKSWKNHRIVFLNFCGNPVFASMLNSSVMLGNYLQQTDSADDIFRCIFILGALRVKSVNWQIIDTTNVILAILLIMPMKYVADGSIQN